MNDVAISGRLTRTPVTHKYKDSVVCNFTIALNEFPQNNSTFVDCVAWGTIADNLAKYQEKGDMIEVTGYIISQYDKNDEFPCNQLKVGCKSIIYLAKSEKRRKKEESEKNEKNTKKLDGQDAAISQEAANYSSFSRSRSL